MPVTQSQRGSLSNGHGVTAWPRRLRARALAVLLGATLAAGCGLLPDAHKVDVQQGNIIDAAALATLEIGMTREQVLFLLGSPVIRDPLHPQRWDYVYYVTPAGEQPSPRRLTLYFDGDRLRRIVDRYSDGTG